MSEHIPDENTNTETGQTQQAVTLDDLRQLEEGDEVALRATKEDFLRIVAGQVTSNSASQAEIDEQLKEYDTAQVATLDLNQWWTLADGEIIDRSHRLEEWPPARPYIGDPPEEAPPRSLNRLADGRIVIVIPTPIYRGARCSRIQHYDTRHSGTVMVLDTGDQADPHRLIPDEYDDAPWLGR